MVTDMRISEDKVIKIFEKALNLARNLNASWNILIIIWHEIVLRIRGGKDISSNSTQKDVQIVCIHISLRRKLRVTTIVL
jgi:hypothetical protein